MLRASEGARSTICARALLNICCNAKHIEDIKTSTIDKRELVRGRTCSVQRCLRDIMSSVMPAGGA